MKHKSNMFRNFPEAVMASLLALFALAVAPAYAEGESHSEAYVQALAKLQAGQSRLLAEVNRIESGAVAHFDFLQYEHIEVLRHARALRYPPSALNTEQRGAIIEQAHRVLVAAEALEWPIADFLRGHALLDSAVSNTIDIASLASKEADEKTRLALQNLLIAAREFQARPEAANLQALRTSFDVAITHTRLGAEPWHEELAAQQSLIAVNVSVSADAKAAIQAASLTYEVNLLAQLLR